MSRHVFGSYAEHGRYASAQALPGAPFRLRPRQALLDVAFVQRGSTLVQHCCDEGISNFVLYGGDWLPDMVDAQCVLLALEDRLTKLMIPCQLSSRAHCVKPWDLFPTDGRACGAPGPTLDVHTPLGLFRLALVCRNLQTLIAVENYLFLRKYIEVHSDVDSLSTHLALRFQSLHVVRKALLKAMVDHLPVLWEHVGISNAWL